MISNRDNGRLRKGRQESVAAFTRTPRRTVIYERPKKTAGTSAYEEPPRRGVRKDWTPVQRLYFVVERAANQLGMTIEEFLAAASRVLTESDPLASTDSLERAVCWYEQNKDRLSVVYPAGTFLAIINDDVIAHDSNVERLTAQMHERYGPRSFFMPQIGAATRELRFRSPHITR